MRQSNAQFKADRRSDILAAAQRCFARSGFHKASMQEICAEAQMSPGNLYRYFSSKEEIIAGISERNRAEAARSFAAVVNSPDFFAGLAECARYHLVERSAEEVGLCAEIMAESRRNPEIAAQSQHIEREVKAGLVGILRHAVDRGEISDDVDVDGAATVLMAIADGIFWRRAMDPGFDAEIVLPLILKMIHCLLAKPQVCTGNEMETPR
ncbi:MAG: TetR/AcrR family transcriptional regulator [Sphingobacteriales bacterium]|jgi:AcrR family transcriptional regulator